MATSTMPAVLTCSMIPYKGNQDANDYTDTGFYYVGITTNSPKGSSAFYGMLLVFGGQSGQCQQLALNENGTYARGRNSSSDSFTAWRQL